MRVFVLTTGRSGSTTFTRACSHATNYTAGHETRQRSHVDRFDYPDQHIEVDNRLCWMLGALHQAHPDARYVHLTRDRTKVVDSYAKRSREHFGIVDQIREARNHWRGIRRGELPDAFAHGIIRNTKQLDPAGLRENVALMVDVMEANVVEFLRDRPHLSVDLADAANRIGEVWEWIGATGDLDAARAEFDVRHNATS